MNLAEQKQTTKTGLFTYTLGIGLSLLLLIGCAKELPDYLSDDIEKNVFPVKAFSKTIQVETYASQEQGGGILAIETNDAVRGAYAINEKMFYPVRFVDGEKKLRPFIEDLTLEANGPGEVFNISFKLTDNYLVAYADARGDESTHLLAIREGNRIPLFQFPIDSYGVLERRENDLGEETRVVEFRSRHRQNSDHVRISAVAENRTYSGIRFEDYDEKNVILKREEIDGKTLDARTLTSWLSNNNVLTATEGLKEDQPVHLRSYRGRLYIQIPTLESDLNDMERGFLAQEDGRIEHCPEQLKQQLGMQTCVLRPAYSVDIDHIRLRHQTDRNERLATVDLDTDIHPNESQFIRLNLDNEVKRDALGQDFSFVDEVLIHKEDIDPEAQYLYMPMTMGAPHGIRAASQFTHGMEKIVTLNWTETGLEVLEVERDDRFSANPLNNKPVMKIKGDHKDFRCRQNDNDECIGGDELVDDVTWSERKFFLGNLKDPEILETNLLDLMTLNSSCLSVVETDLVDYEIDRDVINIKIEKTYRTKNDFAQCIWDHYLQDPRGMSGLSNTTFKAQFYYSMVKLDKLATPEYEAIDYPIYDQNRIGIFRSYEQRLNADNDPNRQIEQHLMNRWAGSGDPQNPREVKYYLSENYFTPENATLLKYTKLSELIINDALKEANADIRITFDTEERDKKPGDLRNNMVILIEDPLTNLLGYGPSVKNPITGEIVQAQTNMYKGVLERISRQSWQQMADLTARNANVNNNIRFNQVYKAQAGPRANDGVESTKSVNSSLRANSHNEHGLHTSEFQSFDRSKYQASGLLAQQANLPQINSNRLVSQKEAAQRSVLERLRRNNSPFSGEGFESDRHACMELGARQLNIRDIDEQDFSEVERMALQKEKTQYCMAINNAYSEDFYRLGYKSTSRNLLPGIESNRDFFKEVDGVEILKEWDELGEDLKAEAMDILVPHSYLTTFIHEIGHNLGLRHNFNGAFDADNFYNDEELAEISQRLETQWIQKNDCANNASKTECQSHFLERVFNFDNGFSYSSIMDYSASSMNQLTIFGKYDVAALRFAYGRQIETEDGQLVDVKETLMAAHEELAQQGLSAKSYGFCTDQNRGLDPSCNVFEEGSTYTEIAEYYVMSYEDNYRYRNFRDGRNQFRTSGIFGYTIGRLLEFRQMREIFEAWEVFADIFGEGIMMQGCNDDLLSDPNTRDICLMINDRRDAALTIGNFLVHVLKTPDLTCAVAEADNPDETVGTYKLSQIYQNGILDNQALRWQIDHFPHTCFDSAIEDLFAAEGLVVRGEGGKFLNSLRDNDDRFPFAEDIYVRGTWVDKAMAMRALFQRDAESLTIDENFRALVDLPEIQNSALGFIEDMVFERPVRNPVPFIQKNGELYEEEYTAGLDNIVGGIPPYFFFLNYFFSLPPQGDEYLNRVLLSMARNFGVSHDFQMHDRSRELVNALSVRNSYVDDFFRDIGGYSITLGDRIYRATPENTFAAGLISRIYDFEVLQESFEADPERVIEIVQARLDPQPPADFNELEEATWGYPDAWLNDLAQVPAGSDIPVDVFVNVFGPEHGPVLHEIFTELGPARIGEIVTIRENARNTAPDGTDDEFTLDLYDVELDNFIEFLEDDLTAEKVEVYKRNLRLLPQHVPSRN